ncbi:E3 ubiquitin-protein ligase KCMF1-like isoform X3 [Ceratina calcarata]|uniref:RING-type E3 ubiquitin transferase n=1 Tax=Ceratina calcarata TaxID=156304 RepID=A0AAJ7NDI2_9HYME|nr:E3 ubiquitin-protein ligase KCMF1-like isoform X3 [Ceratina calcarata]
MNRHDGVSCDACLKGNFRGRRYKCLVCYDYDLCANCYEGGANTTRHHSDHPMQCILTRSEFELYYGGEAVSVEQAQSLTCPYCARMGFTEAILQEHVAADHSDTSFEVVCPLCASVPGGDANNVTDDFAGHLSLEHRSGPRDLISFLDEPTSSRYNSSRRITHSSRVAGGGARPRRSGGGTGQCSSAPSQQLQHLQMQLQLERQQVRAARQQLERLPRRQTQVLGSASCGGIISGSGHSTTMTSVVASSTSSNNNTTNVANPSGVSSTNSQNYMFLLPKCITSSLSDSQLQNIERESANRSLFTRELILGTLSQTLPELTQQESVAETSLSSATALAASPETSTANTSTVSTKKSNVTQEAKRDQTMSKHVTQTSTQQSHTAQTTTSTIAENVGSGLQSQGSPPNSNNLASLNATPTTPMVQTLMHSVLPQSLVLQQSLSHQLVEPIRETIREPIVTPTPAYLRGGVGVTGPSRRKPVRAVDGRNQSTEPPPPH